jgi:glycosyltransferase involved in cell wall biosynthesis
VKVGLVSTLAHGGPVEHTVTLAGALARAGADVRVACATDDVCRRLQARGIDAQVVPVRHSLDVAGGRQLGRRLHDTDVWHAQDRRSGLWVRLLPRRAGTVRVCTVHGLPEPYLPPPLGRRRAGVRAVLAYRVLDAGLGRRSDAVITQSQALRRVLVDRLGWPADRVEVIPNGIDLDRPPVRDGPRCVGTLSSLEPVKGLPVFLSAASRLAATRPDLRFILFGTGSLGPDLRRQVEALGLGGRVDLPGWTETDAALAQLVVLVVTSHMENCPLVVLEAMASGVPVVATAVGGIPEMAPAGTVTLVPVGDARAVADAVGRLLDDHGRAAEQAAAARDHVEREGGADLMAARTLAVYERLLARG